MPVEREGHADPEDIPIYYPRTPEKKSISAGFILYFFGVLITAVLTLILVSTSIARFSFTAKFIILAVSVIMTIVSIDTALRCFRVRRYLPEFCRSFGLMLFLQIIGAASCIVSGIVFCILNPYSHVALSGGIMDILLGIILCIPLGYWLSGMKVYTLSGEYNMENR